MMAIWMIAVSIRKSGAFEVVCDGECVFVGTIEEEDSARVGWGVKFIISLQL